MNTIANHKLYEVRQFETLKEMIEGSVKLYPNNPAFLVKKEKGGPYSEILFTQLLEEMNALGTKLQDLGLTNSKIAIIGENSYLWILSYLAIVNGAGTVVPLDKELQKEELFHLIQTAGCDAIIYADHYRSYFIDENIRIKINMGDNENFPKELSLPKLIASGKELLAQGETGYINAVIDPDEMKILLFTSGTTESSKGVMLSHRNLTYNIIATQQIVHVLPTDRTLSILPIHHTFECTLGVLINLSVGASIAFCEGLKHISKNILECHATMLVGVPLIFESVYAKVMKQVEKSGKLNKLNKAISINRTLKGFHLDLSKKLFKEVHDKFGGKLRYIISGAAALDPNVCRGLENLGFKVLQGYGLTECSPLVAGTPDFLNTYRKAGSVGPAIPGTQINIINQQEDGIGEIICKGSGVMLGYFENPELTASVLKDGWFHTGDLGFIDKEDCLYITGRKKNVIVTKNGKNIYPEEVEYYLNQNDYIEESIVYGTNDDRSGDILVSASIHPAYDVIYEQFGENINEEDIFKILKKAISDLNDRMPIHKRVRNISINEEEFIKTTTKKIKRYANVSKKEAAKNIDPDEEEPQI